MKTKILVNLLLFATALYHPAQSQTVDYPEAVQQKIRLVEDSLIYRGNTYLNAPRHPLAHWMEQENVPGVSIAVIKDYKIEWVKGWGWEDVKEQRPITTETIFRTGSINKSINAFAFLKLKQDGGIDFDQDINSILSEWKFPYTRDKAITPYHLLSHTSGLWYHWTSTYNHGPVKPTLIKMLDRKKSPQDKSKPYLYTSRDPGLKFEYTNVGISVSQQVLIEATGMGYEDYVRKEVFEPLGMSRSFYEFDGKKYRYASGYRRTGKRVQGKYRPLVEYAPAGLWTTPTDLAKYVIELQLSYKGQSNEVLTKESTDFIFTPVKQQLPHNYILRAGLGSFLLNKMGGEKYFFHAGEGSGYTGMFIGSFEGGNGAVVLTNGESDGLVYALVARIAEVYGWKDYLLDEAKVDGEVDLPADSLRKYTGKFRCVEHPENEVEVTLWEDKRLSTIFSGGEYGHPIHFPLGEDTFWGESFSLYSYTKLKFNPDGNNKFDSFTLSNPDKTTRWVRVRTSSE
ncbi:MAG: serine hydrolase domain-containing protein [Bacteroidota bacterium]